MTLHFLADSYEETFCKIYKFLPVGHSYTIRDCVGKTQQRQWEWFLNDFYENVMYCNLPFTKPFSTQLEALKDIANYLEKTYGESQ